MTFWYQPLTWWAWALYPFSLLFLVVSKVRRIILQASSQKQSQVAHPVIVVGNISVGGNGKTPFVIWLCEMLISEGYKPGIVSRGYGGKSNRYPLLLNEDTQGKEAGDEPVMLYKRLGVPIVVDPNRVNAVNYLNEVCDIDITITDDGLQHYALARDIEIVVVDGQRRFGNQKLMPMGPLREPLSRLKEVDFIVNNGEAAEGEVTMLLAPQPCKPVNGREACLPKLVKVNCCAAIGYPQRFFDSLYGQHYKIEKQIPFADHHAYEEADFAQFSTALPLLMTEKDAVKCHQFALPNWWYLPIDAQLPDNFAHQLLQKIKDLK
ncbi:tetraacyldisaccharide 4'-kinase [Psychromonas sp. psych-6C06]|uniref:tetraacyldisaccharide 4'-kinase n=1 Tax=Psychromonas sp. psych-6C06 TaxID=2058089 RepID=UPI000C330047|nr:tetraacyldisaccharide 4'-kinase [Psychromonas sp. psych-6C06]PKF62583.1 tetraacyldisaccharide 4'-kinase [Psychromonas sp. psych-6C06]